MPLIFTTLFSGAWSLVKRALDYPWQAALIVALLACAWLYNGREDARMNLARARDTIEEMKQASKDARAAQIAMNKANTDKQTQIARNADNAKTDIIDRGRAYADSLPAKDYCRKTDSPTQGGSAASGDTTRDTAVILERGDYDILVANTARLVQVKAWGDALIQEELAQPLD